MLRNKVKSSRGVEGFSQNVILNNDINYYKWNDCI